MVSTFIDQVHCFKTSLPVGTYQLPIIQCLLPFWSLQVRTAVFKAADKAITLKKTAGKLSSPPWWDSQCTASVRERNLDENLYVSNLNMDNYTYKGRQLEQKDSSPKKILRCKDFVSPFPHIPPHQWFGKRSNVSSPNPVPNISDPWLAKFADILAPPFVPSENSLPTNSTSRSPQDRMDETIWGILHQVLTVFLTLSSLNLELEVKHFS